MNLEKSNTLFKHQIVDGSEFLWRCYPTARYLDYENEYAHAGVIFDTTNGRIYEATVNPHDDENVAYRWLNPDTKDAHASESAQRGIDFNIAWDNTRWTDLELWDDFAEKAGAIWENRQYDRRIQVPLDLSDEEFMHLARMAHERDMTLNRFVEQILEAAINNAQELVE